MANINWNDGRLITLNAGEGATCTALNKGQLYGLIFYNSAGNDTGADVTVVWGNGNPPETVHVPGTTGNQGLASVFFLNGTDTTTVSATVLPNQTGVQVQTYIASVKMPTNTSGINNISLPADGAPHSFNKFTRYYTVPASHWYNVQINSNINQFISILFTEQKATVFVVNSAGDISSFIAGVGSAKSLNQYSIVTSAYQTVSQAIIGNGSQYVFVNADSVQNSQSASIAFTSLSALYAAHEEAEKSA